MEPELSSTNCDNKITSNVLLTSIINSSPFGKVLIDQNGIIQFVNQKIVDMFGYQQQELIGLTLNPLIPDRYRNNHFNLINSYIQNPIQRSMGAGRDLTALHKSGKEFPVEIGISPIETPDGNFILAAIVDITERKRLELSLNQAISHLEEFNYVASHDLRSPLRGIANLISWIEEDYNNGNNEAVNKNIGRIKIRVERMEKLVDDLLTYAHAGKRSGDTREINLHDLINNITQLIPPPENLTLSIDLQLTHIQAAQTPLETVLRNLYSNAIKHNDSPQPSIHIDSRSDGNYCLISVSDNGPGIPEMAKERVFRLFQTLSEDKNTSSGMGLALARRLVEAHGGKIDLEVKDGVRGSTFVVWWPRFSRSDLDE